jgi:hypothetical protein
MNKKEQNDTLKQTKQTPKNKFDKQIVGLDIDKIEYQQIVLSNSNLPCRDYFKEDSFKQDYYD